MTNKTKPQTHTPETIRTISADRSAYNKALEEYRRACSDAAAHDLEPDAFQRQRYADALAAWKKSPHFGEPAWGTNGA